MAICMTTLNSREEWLEHRMKFIGGSDCSAILGVNPWKSNVQLWLEKTGKEQAPDISGKECVKFGNDAEPIIRELSKLNYPHYEFHYVENNSFRNDKFPFAAASLDGWITDKETGKKGIHEIKTTEIVSSMQKENWNHKIPTNYYCQVLHYLMVCEDCDFVLLTALLTWKVQQEEVYQQLKNYRINRAEVEEDIKLLEQEERKFWECIVSNDRPNLKLPNL